MGVWGVVWGVVGGVERSGINGEEQETRVGRRSAVKKNQATMVMGMGNDLPLQSSFHQPSTLLTYVLSPSRAGPLYPMHLRGSPTDQSHLIQIDSEGTSLDFVCCMSSDYSTDDYDSSYDGYGNYEDLPHGHVLRKLYTKYKDTTPVTRDILPARKYVPPILAPLVSLSLSLFTQKSSPPPKSNPPKKK